MNKEQLKEHIVNNIKELKQHIIIIENLIQNFRISFLYYYPKEKEGTILKLRGEKDDCPYFIGEEVQLLLGKFIANLPDFDFIKKEISKIINEFISEFIYSGYVPNAVDRYIYHINTLLPLTCNKIIEELILKILIKEKQIKFYENIMEHYPEKPNIENIMELYPEKIEIKNKQYSMSPYVIFLIMIVFYIITVTTVILLLNHNNSTTQLDHHIQCIIPTFKNTQFIDKHNKLKDLKKNLIIN